MTNAAKPLVIDFAAVVDELRRQGYSARAIGKHIGVSHVQVLGYRDGAVPQHNVGERLITFWCGITARGRGEVPQTPEYPSAAKAAWW